MPNKLRDEMNRMRQAPAKPKKSFMDRVKELYEGEKNPQTKPDAPQIRKEKAESKKGGNLQEIQERANKLESE